MIHVEQLPPAVFRNARYEARLRRLETQVQQLANALAGHAAVQLQHAHLLTQLCRAPDHLPAVERGFGLGH